ncbi:MAG: hypothetical protein Q8P30_03215 [Candidatus Uhrbacteria bacterium]|nr:hypothetical protein [Candidatus Uhrbacteria bacterium]
MQRPLTSRNGEQVKPLNPSDYSDADLYDGVSDGETDEKLYAEFLDALQSYVDLEQDLRPTMLNKFLRCEPGEHQDEMARRVVVMVFASDLAALLSCCVSVEQSGDPIRVKQGFGYVNQFLESLLTFEEGVEFRGKISRVLKIAKQQRTKNIWR